MDVVDYLLESDFGSDKSEELMLEARAIDRLIDNPDWPVYREALKREMALLFRKFQAASEADQRCIIQGAALQMERVIRLPERIIDRAAKQVDQREDGETMEGEHAARIQP